MAPKPPPPVHMIDVSGASKTFGNVVAVSDVSFTLDAGVTALLGPNGAGKVNTVPHAMWAHHTHRRNRESAGA